MAEILLFMHDFKLGTRVSERLTQLERSVDFVDDLRTWPGRLGPETRVCIVDLEDADFAALTLIPMLRSAHPQVRIVGYLRQVVKEVHDQFRQAGCDLILPQSSLVRNLESLAGGRGGTG